MRQVEVEGPGRPASSERQLRFAISLVSRIALSFVFSGA